MKIPFRFISWISIFGAIFALIFFSMGSFSHASHAQVSPMASQKVQVAILQIVDHEALNATRLGIEDELKTARLPDNRSIEIIYETAQGNPTLAMQIAQKFSGSCPNIMVGIGTTAAQSLVSSNRGHKIPIIFSSVTDPLGARLVQSLGSPGGNISGLSNFIEPERQFTLFKQILPSLTRLGIIYNPGEANSTSLLKSMQASSTRLGIELIPVAAHSTAQVADAALSLNTRVDAIFINNDNTALSAFDAIVKVANQYNIPVLVSDIDMLNHGALAAFGPDQYSLGRQTGKMILKALSQGNANHLPVMSPERVEFHLNTKVCQKLGLKISDSVKSKAVLH